MVEAVLYGEQRGSDALHAVWWELFLRLRSSNGFVLGYWTSCWEGRIMNRSAIYDGMGYDINRTTLQRPLRMMDSWSTRGEIVVCIVLSNTETVFKLHALIQSCDGTFGNRLCNTYKEVCVTKRRSNGAEPLCSEQRDMGQILSSSRRLAICLWFKIDTWKAFWLCWTHLPVEFYGSSLQSWIGNYSRFSTCGARWISGLLYCLVGDKSVVRILLGSSYVYESIELKQSCCCCECNAWLFVTIYMLRMEPFAEKWRACE